VIHFCVFLKNINGSVFCKERKKQNVFHTNTPQLHNEKTKMDRAS